MNSRPIVIAHRGASGYTVEHSAAAVAMAHAMRADYIEQDVVLTADDQPIVLHDVRLETVTDVVKRFPDRKRDDGRFYAIDFQLAELKQLRLNERINSKTGKPVYPNRFPLVATELRIQTLSENLQLIQGLNKSTGREVGIYPEIKNPTWHRKQGKDISRIVLKTLAEHGYKDRDDNAFVQCFEAAEVKRLRSELKTKLKLIQLIGNPDFEGADLTDWDALCTKEGLTELAKYVDGIGPSISRIAVGSKPAGINAAGKTGDIAITKLVGLAHEVGLEVHPYTLRADALPEYAGSFDELLRVFTKEARVDGFFTDFPEEAVRYFE